MVVTANQYCGLNDVKWLLAMKSSADDAWIQSLIPQAQAFIDGEVGFSFQTDGTLAVPSVRTYDGNNRDRIYTGYIQQIIQVTERYVAIAVDLFGTYSLSTTPAQDITADCFIGPSNRTPGWDLRRYSGTTFSPGVQNYTISGIFGPSSIPPDITRACARMVVHFMKMRDSSYADALNEQGGIRIKYSKKTPEDVQEILDNYRLHVFYGK